MSNKKIWYYFGIYVVIALGILSLSLMVERSIEVTPEPEPEQDYCTLGVVECAEAETEVLHFENYIYMDEGVASWYDYDLEGAPGYSKSHLTAASRDFERGTMVLVCTEAPGKCVKVRINDYGPDASVFPNRVIDLSSAAFAKLAPLSAGLLKVEVFEVFTSEIEVNKYER